MASPLLRPDELLSPQLLATSGNRRLSNQLPYEGYISSLATNYLPALREEERVRADFMENRRLDAIARRDARRDARTGLAISGVGTAAELGAFNEGGFLSRTAGSVLGRAAATDAVSSATPAASSAGLLGTLGTAGVGFTAGRIGGDKLNREIGKLGGLVEDKKSAEILGGGLKGALTGFVASGFNPVGALVGFASGSAGGACVIVTACTDPQSYEVNVAREYRDRFMTLFQLRGYYYIAERVVPTIKSSRIAKWFSKNMFVDYLIDYGEWILGKKDRREKLLSSVVSRSFLGLCDFIGSRVKPVVRSNGEVW